MSINPPSRRYESRKRAREAKQKKEDMLENGFDIFDLSIELPIIPYNKPHSSFTNLLGRPLNPHIEHLLSLGLNFALPGQPQSDLEVFRDYNDFKRRVILQNGHMQDKESIPQFYTPNPLYVPPPLHKPAITHYLKQIKNKITQSLQTTKYSDEPTMHPTIQTCISALQHKPDIRITNSDKNCGLVIMHTDDYITEAKRQLLDTNRYTILDKLPDIDTIFTLLENILIPFVNQNLITNTVLKYILQLRQQKPRFAIIYFLPKIHKNKIPIPCRPICSQPGTPTYFASKFLATILLPMIKSHVPSYIDDPIVVLDMLNTTQFHPSTKLLTADIASLYDNIDLVHGLQQIKIFLDKHNQNGDYPTSLILTLLEFILSNNFFTFGNLLVKQKRGCAMGTPVAVAYAIIYIHMLETSTHNILTPLDLYNRPHFFFRWIDDFFALYPNIESAYMFVRMFNRQHPNIQLPSEEIQLGDTSNFLALHVYKTAITPLTCRYDVKLYHKPTSAFQYIHPQSHHNIHTFSSFIKAEIQRILLHSSELRFYYESIKTFYNNLKHRTYTDDFLLPIFKTNTIYIRVEHLQVTSDIYATDINLIVLHTSTRNILIKQRIHNKTGRPPIKPQQLIYTTRAHQHKRYDLKKCITPNPAYNFATDMIKIMDNKPLIVEHSYNKLRNHISPSRFSGNITL